MALTLKTYKYKALYNIPEFFAARRIYLLQRCFDHENHAIPVLESAYQNNTQRSCKNHHGNPQALKPIFRILKMLSCCKNPYGKESVYPITP